MCAGDSRRISAGPTCSFWAAATSRARPHLDGYFTETKEKGFQFDNSGWIKTASVGAGYDASFQEVSPGEGAANAAPFLPRRNGDTLRQNWKSAIAQKPDWVLLDGWNDYDVGAEVAPTLETGYSAADITRQYARMYLGLAKRNVKFLWHNTPATMLAGRIYTVSVRAQNTGVEPWTTETPAGKNAVAAGVPVAWAYRWLRNGTPVGSGAVTPLTDTVLGGQNVNGEISVATTGLAPGEYTLEIRAAEAQKKGACGNGIRRRWAGEHSANAGHDHGRRRRQNPASIRRQCRKRRPAAVPGNGQRVHHQRDPAQRGRADVAQGGRSACHAASVPRHAPRYSERFEITQSAPSAPTETLVAMPDTTAELAADVAPGQTTTVRIVVPAVDADGKPLPDLEAGRPWTYAARWEVAEGKAGAQPVGTPSLPHSPSASWIWTLERGSFPTARHSFCPPSAACPSACPCRTTARKSGKKTRCGSAITGTTRTARNCSGRTRPRP